MLLIAGRLFSRCLQFFLFIYAARQLGVAPFGLFSFAYATVNLLIIAMDLGLSTYLVQQLSRKPNLLNRLLSQTLKLKVVLIPAGFITILTVGFFLAKDRSAMGALAILGAAAVLDSLTAPFNAIFEARQQMKYPALIIAVSNGIMSLSGLLLLWFHASLSGLCLVFAGGALLRCAFSVFLFRRKISASEKSISEKVVDAVDDDRPLSRLLIKALPFAMVTFFVTIYYYIDTLILTALCPAEVVGQYNAAYRLLEAPLFIIQAVTTALFPAASGFYAHDRERLGAMTRQVFQQAAAFGLSIAMVTACVADELVALLYGTAYAPSGPLLMVLIFSVAIIMPSTICGTTLRAADRQKTSALVTGLGALLNIALNLALIPFFSALGAAWATVATEAFVLAVYGALIRRWVGPLFSLPFLLRLALLCIIWWLATTAIQPLGVVAQLVAAVLLFGPFMLALGVVKKDELGRLFKKRSSR